MNEVRNYCSHPETCMECQVAAINDRPDATESGK